MGKGDFLYNNSEIQRWGFVPSDSAMLASHKLHTSFTSKKWAVLPRFYPGVK